MATSTITASSQRSFAARGLGGFHVLGQRMESVFLGRGAAHSNIPVQSTWLLFPGHLGPLDVPHVLADGLPADVLQNSIRTAENSIQGAVDGFTWAFYLEAFFWELV